MFGAWMVFEAIGPETTIEFVSSQLGTDTIGHFLDDVSVRPVPLPGAVVLLADGLLGLGAFRTREASLEV